MRRADVDDAAGWAEVVAACSPYLVQDARSVQYEMRSEPDDVIRLVAEQGGDVIGVSRLRAYPGDEVVSLLVMVHPSARGEGIGRTLLDAQLPAATRTGRHAVSTIVEDDEPSRIACQRWGFSLTRTFRMSMVDPRTLPAPPLAAAGVGVVPLAELGPEAVWRVHSAVVRDDPSGISLPVPLADFLGDWADPRMRPELGRAVVMGGEIAAFSMIGAAGDRAWSDMTGTLALHRGQGLALLAKSHTLAAVAATGVTQAFAGNDAANAAMVAINTRLGYRPFAAPRLALLPLDPARQPEHC